MTVDEATPADLPSLCELLALLFAQEREFRPDETKQRAGLVQLVGRPERGRVFVLREGGALLGMVTVQMLVSTALGGEVLLLEDLVVRPERRGQGCGSALLAHVAAFARDRGCRRITLLTDSDNAAAQRLYARHGFQASGMRPFRLLF